MKRKIGLSVPQHIVESRRESDLHVEDWSGAEDRGTPCIEASQIRLCSARKSRECPYARNEVLIISSAGIGLSVSEHILEPSRESHARVENQRFVLHTPLPLSSISCTLSSPYLMDVLLQRPIIHASSGIIFHRIALFVSHIFPWAMPRKSYSACRPFPLNTQTSVPACLASLRRTSKSQARSTGSHYARGVIAQRDIISSGSSHGWLIYHLRFGSGDGCGAGTSPVVW